MGGEEDGLFWLFFSGFFVFRYISSADNTLGFKILKLSNRCYCSALAKDVGFLVRLGSR